MAKVAVQHACTECGYAAARWFGRCPGCGAFGTLVEEAPPAAAAGAREPRPVLRLVEILAETELEAVCAALERERPAVCVIDSVQTLYSAELGSAPGSVAQVREAAARLLRVAKELGIATLLVGHVTKDGAVAGPRVLEHLVDCVLQFEGDRYHAHRVLRAVKNRFGSTNELGVFEMTGRGLTGVPDPSELFGRTVAGEPGAAVACVLEGTRPLLLEIQALVAPTDLAMPRRVGTGVDPKRLAMIVAVLSRHAGVALGQADVFVNVAPGSELRQAIDDIIRSHEGALVVIGDPQELSFLYSGGIRLDAPFRPQLLYELAKMDGAIIIDAHLRKLAWANVQLMPDPTIA